MDLSLEKIINNKLSQCFEKLELNPHFAVVKVSDRPDLSDFQCNGALALAKSEHKNPREIATQIAAELEKDSDFAKVSVDGPGFLNLTINDSLLAKVMENMSEDERFGCEKVSTPKTVVLDFGAPNVAKEMHVGHLRSAVIGESVQRIERFVGNKVISDTHLGDWGTPMGMIISEIMLMHPEWPYFDDNKTEGFPESLPYDVEELTEIYKKANARCKEDESARQQARIITAKFQDGHPGYRALWQHLRRISVEAVKKKFEITRSYSIDDVKKIKEDFLDEYFRLVCLKDEYVFSEPSQKPFSQLPNNPRDFKTPNYGLTTYGDLFTPRQLVALNTFSDLVQEARTKAIADAKAAGMPDDGRGIASGGTGATAYGDAIATYLAFAVDKLANYCSTINTYANSGGFIVQTFSRQALPMKWDYAESNPIGESTGCWISMIDWIYNALPVFPCRGKGDAIQSAAQSQNISKDKVISTDPPYYDNIGYADLSDYFYVWMRKILRNIYPELFSTVAVPKAEELVATPYRHGGKEKAEAFFLSGMTDAMHNLAEQAHPAFPVTIYYAFKSSDTDDSGTGNTGWETFLAAILKAGFTITGTWPMRTERPEGMKTGSNALASSIVLVCRKRDANAEEVGRREFLNKLREAMPGALRDMLGLDGLRSPIAPVDLAQAAIGPGMEIFSRYKAVLNADGTPMTVHEAMIEINREISDYLNPDGAGFDPATLFCNDWFQQYGWSEGPFGVADTLARAKGTSVDSVKEAGVITASGGKVQLLNWQDYPEEYDPAADRNRPVWEACHHLIRVLNRQGETAAGELLARMPESAEEIRQLAYFLYTLCERRGNAADARYYNELMTSWHAIIGASMDAAAKNPEQMELL